MPFSRFPATGAKTVLNTSARLAIVAGDITANTITATEIGPDAVTASELASGAVTAAGTEIAAGAVLAGNVAVGGVSAANQFASGVVDSAALATGAVAAIDTAAGILPWTSGRFALTNPAVVEMIGSVVANKAVTLTDVRLRTGVLPSAGGAFSFNVRIAGTGDIFASDQVVARHPNVTAFRKTTDIGVTYTDYTANVVDAGAGVADLSSLDTVANGDWVVVGYSAPFAGVNIDMAAAVNGSASVLTAEYWNGAWTACPNVTDGTAAAGATFGQDGVITFDTPVDWIANTIDGVNAFHVRLSVSAALDASTEVTEADVVRDIGFAYSYTPDQNLTVPAGALLLVDCAEADANATTLEIELVGTVTTGA